MKKGGLGLLAYPPFLFVRGINRRLPICKFLSLKTQKVVYLVLNFHTSLSYYPAPRYILFLQPNATSMKQVCSLLFISFLFSSLAFSQITVTSQDILSLTGNSFTQEGYFGESEAFPASPGMAGANQTWMLDTIAIDTSALITWSFELPENTPFGDSFPDANFVQVFAIDTLGISTASYNYAKISDTEYISIGDVSVSSFFGIADTSLSTLSDTVAIFPLTFEKSWTTTSVDSFEFFGTTEIEIDTTENLIDGYGNVVIPAGTFECLRLQTVTKSTSFNKVGGAIIDTTESIDVSYIWITKNAFLAATMDGAEGSSDTEFTTASSFSRLFAGAMVDTTGSDTTMTDTTGTDTMVTDTMATPIGSLLEVVEDVELSPNPAVGELTISFRVPEKMPMDVAIYDLRGRKVHTLTHSTLLPGEYAYSWQGKTNRGNQIRSGWYVAVLTSGKRGHAMKFLWQN